MENEIAYVANSTDFKSFYLFFPLEYKTIARNPKDQHEFATHLA